MTATANTSLIMNLGAGTAANPSAGSRAAPKSDDQPRLLFETALNSHLQARQQAQLPFASSAATAAGPARTAEAATPGGNFSKPAAAGAAKPTAPKAPPQNNAGQQADAQAPTPPDPAPASGSQASDGDKQTTTASGDGTPVKKVKSDTAKAEEASDAAAPLAVPMTFYDVLKAQGMLNTTPANVAASTDTADAIAVDTGAAGAQAGNLAQLEQSLQTLVDGKGAPGKTKAGVAADDDGGVLADKAQVAGGKAEPKTIQEVIDAAKALAKSNKPAELTPEEQKTPFTAVAAKAADAAAAAVPNTAKTFAELVTQQVARQENSQAQQPIQLMSPPRMADTAKVAGAGNTAESDKSLFAVHVPVGADGWDRAIGQKVVMMVSNQRQEVEMQLNPPHLGPIDVKLSMKDGEASLSFSSNHAQVREAIQASMPKLSEMMAENGIQLASADVYSGSSQQQQQQGGNASEQKSWRNPSTKADDGVDIAAAAPRRQVWAGNLPGNLNFFV